MARPRLSKDSNSSLLKRVDPDFRDLGNEMIQAGEVHTFPEFTRRILDELKDTRLKNHIKFRGFFK